MLESLACHEPSNHPLNSYDHINKFLVQEGYNIIDLCWIQSHVRIEGDDKEDVVVKSQMKPSYGVCLSRISIPLTSTDRAIQRSWTPEHLDWTQCDWSLVLFADESKFSWVWHLTCSKSEEKGPSNYHTFVQERSQYIRGGLKIWNGVSIGGRMDLHIIRNSTLMTQTYEDEILRHPVVSYAAAMVDSFFMYDNVRPSTAQLEENML